MNRFLTRFSDRFSMFLPSGLDGLAAISVGTAHQRSRAPAVNIGRLAGLALVAFLSFSMPLLAACDTQQEKLASANQAHELVANGALLLDVRTPGEYERGHIDGAVNIPVSEVSQRIDEIKKHDKVVVYCESGPRANQAAQILTRAGIDVYNLGPMKAWYK